MPHFVKTLRRCGIAFNGARAGFAARSCHAPHLFPRYHSPASRPYLPASAHLLLAQPVLYLGNAVWPGRAWLDEYLFVACGASSNLCAPATTLATLFSLHMLSR